MKYTVAIVDDHQLIAKAIGSMVDGFANFEVLFEATNGSDMIENFRARNTIPDIVLLDISMPVMNGFETAEWLQRNHPEVKILVLSMQDDDDAVLRMVKFGIKGYLHKNVHPLELEKALSNLVNEGMYFPNWAATIIFQTLSYNRNKATGQQAKPTLNARELEFMSYVCSELTYKEIADRMCCSPRTVEGYRDSLFEKLHLKTRVGLAMYAMQEGLNKQPD